MAAYNSPQKLKRSATGGSNYGSPAKKDKILGANFFFILTPPKQRLGRGKDTRGLRRLAVVSDQKGDVFLLTVFSHLDKSFINQYEWICVSNYDTTTYSQTVMTSLDKIVSATSIEISNMSSLQNKIPSPLGTPILSLTTFSVSDILLHKPSNVLLSIKATVISDLDVSTRGYGESKFDVHCYRIADETGNIVLTVPLDQKKLFAFDLGKTYKLHLLKPYLNTDIVEGVDISITWWSNLSETTNFVASVNTSVAEQFSIVGQIDSVSTFSISSTCFKCKSSNITLHSSKNFFNCGTCNLSGKKSSLIEHVDCSVGLTSADGTAYFVDMHSDCLPILFGEEYKTSILTTDCPTLSALDKCSDKSFRFKFNSSRRQIVAVSPSD